MSARYNVVPAQLPAQLPAITREQGIKLARLVVRKFWPRNEYAGEYRLTYWVRRWNDEGRRVWVSKVPTAADNHNKGVGRLVHDLSHEIFSAVYPTRKPHDPLHAEYERQVAAYVAQHSALARIINPPVKAVPRQLTKSELRSRKLIHVRESIKRWETKAKRAATALRKLRASERGLERAMYEHDLRPLTINGQPAWEPRT